MKKILIATNNQGKVIELQELLNDINVELITPAQINLDLDVIEDGLTYAENATKKALAFAQASDLISVADDSGLEVDALNGAPGLYSARYGSTNGVKLSDAERRQYLLAQLQNKPHPWTAHFQATIAIAIPESLRSPTALLLDSPQHTLTGTRAAGLQLFEGICPGEVIPEERGIGGFGYDPIFLLPELGKTMAELSVDEKNRLSHRARAMVKAKAVLKTLSAQQKFITPDQL